MLEKENICEEEANRLHVADHSRWKVRSGEEKWGGKGRVEGGEEGRGRGGRGK